MHIISGIGLKLHAAIVSSFDGVNHMRSERPSEWDDHHNIIALDGQDFYYSSLQTEEVDGAFKERHFSSTYKTSISFSDTKYIPQQASISVIISSQIVVLGSSTSASKPHQSS